MVTRRALIQNSTFGMLALTSLARQARAMGRLVGSTAALPGAAGTSPQTDPQPEPHFFVFVQMQGAWDVCLAFDPKDRTAMMSNGMQAFDQPYSMADVRSYRGIPLAPQGVALAPHADRLAIINGIDMEMDVGHTADTVMTGTLNPRGSDVPYVQALLTRRQSYVHGRVLPHIYACYDDNFFGGGESLATVVAAPNDVVTMLGMKGDSGGNDLSLVGELVNSYSSSLPESAERLAFAPYVEAVPRAEQLVAQVRAGGLQAPVQPDSAAGMGQLFGQLFARGITASITWELGFVKYDFDTHGDHYKNHPLHFAMADVAALMQELNQIPLDAHTSVGDRTTVVLASEFCRTARLNSGAGKDHNTHTNSLVLLGHRVRAGVFGASGERLLSGNVPEAHAALPIDLTTGQRAEGGSILRIRDVWAGLGSVFGTDLTRDFGADAKPIAFLG